MNPDVLVIGAGPVGLTAALLLARHGLRVEVFEKRAEPMTEPRAVSLDDESLRIWQSCGLGELLRDDWAAGEPGQCMCTYLDENDRPFLRLYQQTSELGHPYAVAIHQGRIEQKLMHAAERHPSIRVRRGHTVQHITQTERLVHIGGEAADGGVFERHAAWAIACDGAGSAVRRRLRIEMIGEQLKRPWLVANVEDHGDPGHVMIRCRSSGAAVTMPMPHGVRRVEVQLAEDDTAAWVNDDAEVRRRLSIGWSGAGQARIHTLAVCRFRAAMAERWRHGRIFLAGDAAHVMPPFAGQGLGAGLRDVANLAFKIAGVCQGWLATPVLDSYELERRPHVQRMTHLACRLGRLMNPSSRPLARVLHSTLRLIGSSPALGGRWLLRGPTIQPTLSGGFIEPSRHAGRYLPQPEVVAAGGRTVRLDELLGPRMTWLVLSGPAGLRRLEPPLLQPTDTVLKEGRDFRDPDRVLSRRYGPGSLLLVRPDRVVCQHLRSSRFRALLSRNISCASDITSLRQVLEVTSSPSASSPPRSPAASPTAPILWS